MDEEYIEILNHCIISVEDILLSYSYEDLPFCLFILEREPSGSISVAYVRGTRKAPARPKIDDVRPQLLIKDAHDFDRHWSVISGFGEIKKFANPHELPTFTKNEIFGTLAMSIELLCRGITQSLSIDAHTRMFGT